MTIYDDEGQVVLASPGGGFMFLFRYVAPFKEKLKQNKTTHYVSSLQP